MTCTVHERRIRKGAWEPERAPASGPGSLVIAGLLSRRVRLGDHFVAELVGPGDLVSPRVDISGWATIEPESRWQVLADARLAVLDADFAVRAAPFPGVSTALVRRALLRSRYLSVMLAIASERRLEERLRMIMWHLADRFGRRGEEWVDIPLPLTHSMLGELVVARRPSVTAGISALTARGVLRQVDGGWQIRAGEGDQAPTGATDSEGRERQGRDDGTDC